MGSLNCSLAKSIRGFRSMGGPSLDLCRSILALRDPALGGRLPIESVPPLIALLRFWKVRFSSIIQLNYFIMLFIDA